MASREMQAALYVKGASTHSLMPEILPIPFPTDEFRVCGNFDPPPHLMKRVSHMLGGTALFYRRSCLLVCCGGCRTIVTTPSLFYPPLPQDKQEVEPALDLLKSMALVGRAALDKLSLPPPLAHAAHDAILLGTALEKFVGGVFNTQAPPTVAIKDITEAGDIIYLI